MSTVKLQDAAKAARKFLREAYADLNFTDILLEEIELSDDGSKWFVTLGFNRLVEVPFGLMQEHGVKKLRREFKTMVIDSASGAVLGMKMKGSAPSVE